MTWLDSPVNKADWFCYSSVFLNSYPTVNKPCYWINYSVNQCVCNRRPLQQGDHVLLMLLRNWLNSFIELCLHELPKAPHSPEPEENPMHFSVNPFLYCEAVGFIISECPVRPPHLQVRYIHTLLVIHSPLCTKLTVIRSYITLNSYGSPWLRVRKRLREHRLLLKMEKCEFQQPMIHFLCNNISPGGAI